MHDAWRAAMAGFLLSMACAPGGSWIAPEELPSSSSAARSLTVGEGVPFFAPGTAATQPGFGGALALSGDTLLLATAYWDVSVTGDPGNVGPVFVFVRSGDGWVEQGRLFPAALGERSQFGQAVAISGDRAIVGSHGQNEFAGAAFVFVRVGGTWALEATLQPDGGGGNYQGFGMSVALAGDVAVVGQPYHLPAPNTPPTGAAYVFVREAGQWRQKAVLKGSRIQGIQPLFGTSVAIEGRFIAVGAPREEVDGKVGAGAVYLFDDPTKMGSFSEVKRLEGSDVTAADNFGGAVALSNGRLAVGASWSVLNYYPPTLAPPGLWSADLNVGKVYVFDRGPGDNAGGWMQTARLVTPSTAMAAFGESLSLQGDLLLVGAPNEADLAGAAYLYRLSASGWQLVKRLAGGMPGADSRTGDALGRVCLDSLTAIVAGNAWKTPRGPGPVRIYAIRRDNGEPCFHSTECGSGQCVDGVCCSSACGVGALDCQACSMAAGGTQDGLCTPLSAARAAAVTCRGANGACDRAEVCAADAPTCPGDRFVPDGESCADEKACNGGEVCASGKCVAGTPLICADDDDPCTVATCADDVGCFQKANATCPRDAGAPQLPDAAPPDAPGAADVMSAADGVADGAVDPEADGAAVGEADATVADARPNDAQDATSPSDAGVGDGGSDQVNLPSCACDLGSGEGGPVGPFASLVLAVAMGGRFARRGRRLVK